MKKNKNKFRHYVKPTLLMGNVMVLYFAIIMAISYLVGIDCGNCIGYTLGYITPCICSILLVVIFAEQQQNRFKAQWQRNAFYYHGCFAIFYILCAFFLRPKHLLNAMADGTEDKLPMALAFLLIPIAFYWYRICVPYKFVKVLRRYIKSA